uniref:Uncharacterized protein n=1 Tax=Candidatus Kentrum sp. FW TaxID=2126338 RepID=A0A450SZT3_9GAMM|nr:MAG: hypothetical protein BECKFW1821B_GA0114236_10509 [Candidatus Kentron sp. FW]
MDLLLIIVIDNRRSEVGPLFSLIVRASRIMNVTLALCTLAKERSTVKIRGGNHSEELIGVEFGKSGSGMLMNSGIDQESKAVTQTDTYP